MKVSQKKKKGRKKKSTKRANITDFFSRLIAELALTCITKFRGVALTFYRDTEVNGCDSWRWIVQ
jgi:hypothetical protein